MWKKCKCISAITKLSDLQNRKEDNWKANLIGMVFQMDQLQRKILNIWNKMNTDYYLVIYSFEGLSEETTKEEFLREVRVFMYPPKNREGKTPIYLLLSTSFK